MSQRCVTLYGLMGAGKTSVGEALADMLGYDFVDTDVLIKKKAGMSISRIFQEQGEDAFRALEAEVIAGLRGQKSKVIATGGGAVLNPDNRAVFTSLGLTVYLKATARELYQRIKNDTSRPLLQTENPRQAMADLLMQREPLYLEADIIVDTEDLSVEEVTDQLIDKLAALTTGDG